ncbi:MAG TPA: Sec-independent protein translocase protein TatB [Alphaproteobacteria bacterium]|nr:Sec-independent protein translocase protein TatB [Alphaproteobacteria bacterium]
MLEIGWQELLVIAVVAIIVVGPRELPQMMRTIGLWMGKARRMAREFQNNIEEMGREVELDALRRDIDSFRRPLDPFRIDAQPSDPAALPVEPDTPPAPKA